MPKLTSICCVLAFLFGAAAGSIGGHYHGVAVTLQGFVAGQIQVMEALK